MEREEKREQFRQAALAIWTHFQTTACTSQPRKPTPGRPSSKRVRTPLPLDATTEEEYRVPHPSFFEGWDSAPSPFRVYSWLPGAPSISRTLRKGWVMGIIGARYDRGRGQESAKDHRRWAHNPTLQAIA